MKTKVVAALISAMLVIFLGVGIVRSGSSETAKYASPTRADLYSVSMVGPDHAWAVGYGGAILNYIRVVGWRNETSPETHTLDSVSMAGVNQGWAVGSKFIFYFHPLRLTRGRPIVPLGYYLPVMVSWDGQQWTNQSALAFAATGSGTGYSSVFIVAPNYGWIVGGHGGTTTRSLIVHWDGNAWYNVTNLPSGGHWLRSVHACALNDAWAVGDFGTTLHWNGLQWTISAPSPTTYSLSSVYMRASNDVWAVGNNGTIIHWNGGSWASVSSPTRADLRSVCVPGVNEGWAVGAYGAIIRWDGTEWRNETSPTTTILYSVCSLDYTMPGEPTGWMVGYNGTIIARTQAGWIPEFSASNLTLILFGATLVTIVLLRKRKRKGIIA